MWTTIAFVKNAIPQAEKELRHWCSRARQIPCALLREQALASIALKKFHVLGGSVYTLYPGGSARKFAPSILRAIVSLQTISDYLDNLCDRAGQTDEQAFRRLHKAMSDALDPYTPPEESTIGRHEESFSPYYFYYPYREDGGYLAELVHTCRTNLAALPSYRLVMPYALELARLYSDLQSLKHLDQRIRRSRLEQWATRNMKHKSVPVCWNLPDEVEWWEFAAATGSTLGLFVLFAMAAESEIDERSVKDTLNLYFPWICGLHILLDYLIDLDEDKTLGDFNFVACYPSEKYLLERFTTFIRKSAALTREAPRSSFHLLVIRGLLALYLSDRKVKSGGIEPIAQALCAASGTLTTLMRRSCMVLRHIGIF